MHRKSDKDIIKSNTFMIVICTVLVLAGILLPLMPILIPKAEYDELITKEIVIESVDEVRSYKHWFPRITTVEGEQYNITGDYSDINVYKDLLCGKPLTIKYYENQIFFTLKKYAEVVIVDGVTVVHYDNDKDDVWIMYLLSAGCLLLAAGGGYFVAWQVRNNRKKQATRDRKIAKKYGSIKKS